MSFKDHFSGVADAYAAARPEYPDELFDLIATHVPREARVWEPGCGSGQATRGLAARFPHVYATDPSAQQIAQHWAQAGARNVSVAVEPGERTTLPDGSVELVAVAQALHWFDRAAFFAECERVLVRGGLLAAWGYGDFIAPEGMVEAVEDFRALIEPYWPPERALIDAHYAGLEWPFPAQPAPALWLEAEWSLPHFLRYLSSMSAVARCRADLGEDPVSRHAPALTQAWGEADDVRTIRWPLFLHLRRTP
ncbi:class I SAM-dependent methyltransferase [Lysobacter tyrosinilyticus]